MTITPKLGDRLITKTDDAWSDGQGRFGQAGRHRCTLLVEIVEESPGYRGWKTVKCLKETGRPPQNARPAPQTGGWNLTWLLEQLDNGEVILANPAHAHCTCHEPPRPMTRDYPGEEWAHDDDETFAEVRHVHGNYSSRDCDGPHQHSTTFCIPAIRPEALIRPSSPDGHEPDFDDLWTYLVRHEPPLGGAAGYASITVEPGHVHWTEETDEGHSSGEVYVCDATYCASDPPTQRDEFAERMGY